MGTETTGRRTRETPELAKGTLIGGRYRLEQHMGRGRWVAQDCRLHRTVAARPISLSPQSPQPGQLRHPSITTVYDVIVEGRDAWAISEYVPSRTLAEFISGHGPLRGTDTASLGAQLATALAVAHERDVIHRAVQPTNVLLADDGGVQITDFASGMDDLDAAYRAPEVAAGDDATTASDVYSLGATLFVAACRRTPFGPRGKNPVPAPYPDHEQIAHVLMRMLSRDPRLRPAMSGCADALSAIANGDSPSPGSLNPAVGGFAQPAASARDVAPGPSHDTIAVPLQPVAARRVTPPAPEPAVPAAETVPAVDPVTVRHTGQVPAPIPEETTTPSIPAQRSADLAAKPLTSRPIVLITAILLAALAGIIFAELVLV